MTKKFSTARVFWIVAVAMSFILAAMVPSVHAKDKTPPTLKWLKVPDKILESWQMEFDPKDEGVMYVTSQWKSKEKPRRIFTLIPKKSGSYNTATASFLRVLREEDIPARIVIVNFENEEERGRIFFDRELANGIDLIFSMGSESADFVQRNALGLDVPVVTCTNKDPVLLGQVKDYTSGSGTNIAYTSLNVPIDIQMNYIRRLKPGIKNIGLMYDRNHAQVMATEVIPLKESLKNSGVKVIDVAVESADTAVAELERVMPDAIGQMLKTDAGLGNSIFWITSSTSIFDNIEAINKYSGNIPVLSSIPNVVKDGMDSAVIAIGIDRGNNAHMAARYAADILKGRAKPGDLPVGIVTPPDVAVNFGVARKIGLKIPFGFFESAAFVYDYEGRAVRLFGQRVEK